jgi:hypothetical protein
MMALQSGIVLGNAMRAYATDMGAKFILGQIVQKL